MLQNTPSLALGIGLQGKPESTQKFQLLREQGAAKAKQAEADAIEEERKGILKRLATVNDKGLLPYQRKIISEKQADLILGLSKMSSGDVDYIETQKKLNDFIQTAAAYETIAKDVYGNKNTINNRSKQILTTEEDLAKIKEGLDPTSEYFFDDNGNLGRGQIKYEATGARIDKLFRDPTYYSPDAQERDLQIGDKKYRIYGVTDGALYNMQSMFQDPDFLAGARHDYAETLRGQNLKVDVNSPEFISGTQNYIGQKIADASAARQKFLNTDLRKTNYSFDLRTGNGEPTSLLQGNVSSLFNVSQTDENNKGKTYDVQYVESSTGQDAKATLAVNSTWFNREGNSPYNKVGSVTAIWNQVGVSPVAKKDGNFGNVKFKKGQAIPQELIEKYPRLVTPEDVEYRAIALGLTNDKTPKSIYTLAELPARNVFNALSKDEKEAARENYILGEKITVLNNKLKEVKRPLTVEEVQAIILDKNFQPYYSDMTGKTSAAPATTPTPAKAKVTAPAAAPKQEKVPKAPTATGTKKKAKTDEEKRKSAEEAMEGVSKIKTK